MSLSKISLLKWSGRFFVSSYYKIYQQNFKFIAIAGILGNVLFYCYLEFVQHYWESLFLRTVVISFFTGILLLPVTRPLNWLQKFYFELTLVVGLPIFFTIFMFMNNVNIYWAASLMMAAALYGFLSNPAKSFVLFPLSFFMSIFLLESLSLVSVEVIDRGVQLFAPAYFICILMSVFLTIFKDTLLELEKKNKLTEENENILRLSEGAANQANLAKSTFLANMSHEIRTPLNAINGFSQILLQNAKQEKFSKDSYRYVQYINQSGEHLAGLVGNILDFSKIEAGKVFLIEQTFNLSELIESIHFMLAASASEKGLKFDFEVAPDLPAFISLDNTKFRQILINLCSNAIKFTDAGDVSMRLSRQNEDVLICISDEGIGIDPGRQEEIFNVFEQADNSITRRFGGAGLGLAITKLNVELMNGGIWLDSEVGKGSIFYVRLPFKYDQNAHPVKGGNTFDRQYSGKNIVLVVEDDKMNQRLIEALFSKMNLSITLADNGRAGIEKILELNQAGKIPDLVLMDLQMPVMGGFEAVETIRKSSEIGNVPVVALSGNLLPEYQDGNCPNGFSDYLGKPIELDKLLRVLDKYLVRE